MDKIDCARLALRTPALEVDALEKLYRTYAPHLAPSAARAIYSEARASLGAYDFSKPEAWAVLADEFRALAQLVSL